MMGSLQLTHRGEKRLEPTETPFRESHTPPGEFDLQEDLDDVAQLFL